MANYVDHIVKRLAPAVYFPCDDVAASSAARQLGALTGVTGTYGSNARRTHGIIDAALGRGGALTQATAAGNANRLGEALASSTFQSGTTATGWSASWWSKNKRAGQGNGVLLISPGTYTDPAATCWVFNPYNNDLTYLYMAAGALATPAYAFPGNFGHWSHWCVTWSSTTITLWRNGRPVTTVAGSFTALGSTVAIMKVYADIGTSVKHVAYWNRVLAADEIRLMHRLRGT